MIRKESSQGIGYAVVDLGKARHVFASALPLQDGDLETQARDALQTIEAVIREEGTQGSIVHQAVFLRDIRHRDACRQIMRDFYGNELPATTYIPQPPCEGKLLEIEALGVGRGGGEVAIHRYSEQMVVTSHDGIDWVHLANVLPGTTAAGVYDRSQDAFRQTCRELASHGYHYDQVLRTWLYLGDIVGPEGDTQRYLELNRARSDFYHGLCFGNGHLVAGVPRPAYPASTGIGCEGHDVIISSIALATQRNDVRLVPLENPCQTAAFDYAPRYSPQSPKFARAMAIATGDFVTILVSGTASILASETQHVGDIEGQTWQTLDNIAALISADNLSRHGLPGFAATLDDMALVRVYVKRQADYAEVRDVCRCRLGELPTIYAIADVCRPELLVEIEGIAIAARS